jgi:hypothetical protein
MSLQRRWASGGGWLGAWECVVGKATEGQEAAKGDNAVTPALPDAVTARLSRKIEPEY